MSRESLFRGELRCAEPNCMGSGFIIEPVDERTYRAWCGSHRPEGVWDRAVMVETCLSPPWGDVKTVTLHELKPCSDRRGDIITVEMKDVPNADMMFRHAIEVLQYLTIVSNDRYTIREIGKDGEDNDSWIFTRRWERPIRACIHHKYWGDRQIENIRQLTRTMAKIHEWELIDETVSLLDRIVQAIDVDTTDTESSKKPAKSKSKSAKAAKKASG